MMTAPGKYKQPSLYDMMMVSMDHPPSVYANRGKCGTHSSNSIVIPENYGCEVGNILSPHPDSRAQMIHHLRKGMENHFSMSYRGECIVNIRDRIGGGYIIERREGYMTEETIVCGLVRMLEERYTTKKGDDAIDNMYTMSTPFSFKPNAKREGKWRSARDRGLRIHQLIYHKVECIQSPSGSEERSLLSSEETNSGYEAPCKCKCIESLKNDPWTADEFTNVDLLLRYLDVCLRITPVFSELFLWDPQKRLATRIDLLCINSEMNFVLVSIKTGIYGRPGKSSGDTDQFFKPPLNHIRDSIKTRHDLQLLTELLLLVETYKVPVCDAVTIYVDSRETPPVVSRYISDFVNTSGMRLDHLLAILSCSINKT